MAYRKDKTTVAQTAFNVAGEVVAQLAATGKLTKAEVTKAVEALETVFDAAFAKLSPIVDGDNELFASLDDAPAPKGGGSRKSSSSSKTKQDTSKPGALAFDKGKFKGQTIEDIYNMSPAEAEKFGHRNGEPGSTYITWSATEENPNKFMRDMCAKFLEEVS